MHEPAGVVENLVQILQNTPILKYRIPPPPQKWKLSEILALWLFSFRIPAPLPPPPPKMKMVRNLGTLTFQFQKTPPPRKLKSRQILAFCDFSVSEDPPPPRKLKFRQILALFSFKIPPPQKKIENWNLGRSWHFVTFQFQNTSPPQLKFRQIFLKGNYVWQVTTCGDFIQPG